eukprot:15078363-Alexandrium_andersonii.AAC.1
MLQDPWYEAYGRMLLAVHGALDSCSSWVGTCPCHPPESHERGSNLRARRRSQAFGSVDCPCVGAFSPQLVAGDLHDRA